LSISVSNLELQKNQFILETRKWENEMDMLLHCPDNKIIKDNLIKAYNIINSNQYKKIVCSISGGSDSDVVMDIVWRCDIGNKVDYVWFDTGLEFQATKNHLSYLEEKYNVSIMRYKAVKPIPTTCKEYGVPFISKQVSEFISRLQKHNFKWEDESFEILNERYPNCKSALEWWCNNKGETSRFNINPYLKQFMVKHPIPFKVSNKCCDYAKKKVSYKLIKDGKYDLDIVGIRKAEGGARASAHKSCWERKTDGCDHYYPIFWYKNFDKECYDKHFNVKHSNCYCEYGMRRTGCAGCSYSIQLEEELDIIRTYEPKLYKAVNNIFGESYEYTMKYKEFVKQQKALEKVKK